MNRIFAITAASDCVPTGGDGRCEITFTVTNSSARQLRGQLHVTPLGSTKGEWLNIAGETEREFPPNAAQQVVVNVNVNPGAPAGKYQFRLDAVSVINPDDDFTEGPTVDLEVKATEIPKKAFPWGIIAAGAGAVILVVALTWLLWPKSVEVPDVVGLDLEEAAKKFADLNLKVEVTRQINASVLRDHIFGQDPEGKSKARAGATVRLLVATQMAAQQVAAQKEVETKGAPEPLQPATMATPPPLQPAPTATPTPLLVECRERVFRFESQRSWVEFRLPKGIQGQVINIPKGAYNKNVSPGCSRVWWEDLTFSCRGTRLWESIGGVWGSDNQCQNSPVSSPYLVTGDR